MQWFSNLIEELGVAAIWLPSKELQDLRALLRHRHQWVRMPTRVQSPGEWPPPRHCPMEPRRTKADRVVVVGTP
jgi:hypothetical protein